MFQVIIDIVCVCVELDNERMMIMEYRRGDE